MNPAPNAYLCSHKSPESAFAALTFVVLAFLLPGSAAAATNTAPAPDGGRSGKAVVESTCLSCHRAGLLSAPKINDVAAWRDRAGKGLSALTAHALDGVRQMPDHGGDPSLTELELGRAVTYMVNQSGGAWVEPASPQTLGQARSGAAVVKARCATCHETGAGGAPKIGDTKSWASRASQGLGSLTASAIRGHGGMPPRGGMADATDAELRAAISYMFYPTMATGGAAQASPSVPLDTGGMRRTVAGMDILLGVVPASRLRGFPPDSPERKMHGGVPAGRDQHHLNITVLQHTDGTPIADARVEVIVEDQGHSRVTKLLNPIVIGVPFYGGYVPLASHTQHQITVLVSLPGAAVPARAQFAYRN